MVIKSINYLEILACFLTLKASCSAYINSMGGRKSQWQSNYPGSVGWCLTHNIWLTAVHICRKQNVLADKESREKHSDIEWKLNTQLFEGVTAHWGTPSIDIFASRLNYQFKPFDSWRPDQEAMTIDAFSINWKENFYAFPPFAFINRILRKVEQDQSQGIIIVPLWTTQVWFPRLLHMLIDYPITLPKVQGHCHSHQIKRDYILSTRNLPSWHANYQEFRHNNRHFGKSCQIHSPILEREYTKAVFCTPQ